MVKGAAQDKAEQKRHGYAGFGYWAKGIGGDRRMPAEREADLPGPQGETGCSDGGCVTEERHPEGKGTGLSWA